MQFHVRYFDAAAAAVRQQTMEATSQAALTAQLEQAGHAVMSVAKVGGGSRARGGARLDIAWWCREFRTLLHAGMTAVEALQTLQERSSAGTRATVQASVLTQLQQGRSLSAALAASGAFPVILVAGVKASERTGALIDALDEYLRYHALLDQLRKRLVSAAMYPALVVTLGVAISLFLMLFVMPRFAGLYGEAGQAKSLATGLMMAMSNLLRSHGWLVLAMVVGLAAMCVNAWRSGALQARLAALAERIGPLQRQIDEFRFAKLYQSLALMFRGGYPLSEALQQSTALGLGERIGAGVSAAQSALARGERVSVAFANAGLTDGVSQRLLAVGERTGNFDRVLQTIAERHAETFTTFIERTTRLVEPLLMLLVALVVGTIVVMMYMPVFDIATSIRGGP